MEQQPQKDSTVIDIPTTKCTPTTDSCKAFCSRIPFFVILITIVEVSFYIKKSECNKFTCLLHNIVTGNKCNTFQPCYFAKNKWFTLK